MIGRALGAMRYALATRSHSGHSPAGIPLPPVIFRMGGRHFCSDHAFLESAVREVQRLRAMVGLTADTRLLDWGCGAGRLAIGVAEEFGRIEMYHGIDVQRHLVAWAARHLGIRHGFRFTHFNAANARYNPKGSQQRSIPVQSDSYDVFYAYSVFSHMRAADVSSYMNEVFRLLRPAGFAFITAFVEDHVIDEEENPFGYGPLKWEGPLHCVRFRRGYFESIAGASGLVVEAFTHGGEADGQSLYLLRKPSVAQR